jgi:hypothetical protein
VVDVGCLVVFDQFTTVSVLAASGSRIRYLESGSKEGTDSPCIVHWLGTGVYSTLYNLSEVDSTHR